MPTAPIRAAAATDEAELVDVLTDAFSDDPIFDWVFGGVRDRSPGTALLFRAFLRVHYLGLGASDLTTDGAAVWAPPGKHDPGLAILRGVPAMLRAFGPRLVRPVRQLAAMDRHHPKEPHWYLFFLGVRGRSQGTGIGSALLADRLAEVDAAGMPAYLENSNPRNLPLYQRHGFEVTSEFYAAKDAPPLYAMWREARPA